MQLSEQRVRDVLLTTQISIQEFMDQLAAIRCLANNTRFRILTLIPHKGIAVENIASALNMTSSAVSHQLALLRRHEIVTATKRGRNIIYRMNGESVRGKLVQKILRAVR
ncbi:ArsR/SmtB family transcription factor [Rhodopseudomonas palustris]|uniref:ArsR/SmtB family transcription factor n=1 Tax=Rhodopseudomonas palustris TaxID=1076 RepID=UPI000D1BBD89|nr:metalloregulator ArsR/SmtB family transcription factor [Rhodopseudomonas palustris]AVT83651.1 hypothetical protein RPYSC3_47910 [Rhodopseudomonas palustris]